MSFSREVKEELSKLQNLSRHCQIAEAAAIISMCGNILISVKDEYAVTIHTENLTVARKYYLLLKSIFHINPEISVRKSSYLKKGNIYTVTVKEKEISYKILQTTKLLNKEGMIAENLSVPDNIIIQNICCKRAFIRGAFLASGSISDPEKTYHFEIVTVTELKAVQLKEIINSFDVEAKVIRRKKYFVVYVKDGSQIVELLNIMEAHISLMKLENVRILKEMRNSINRKVNCETANISKTVKAASKQIEDIMYIRDIIGFGELTESLEEIARLRIEQPDASLKELGALLSHPIGKSGVNHRLRKLSIIADNLKEQKEEISYGIKKNKD